MQASPPNHPQALFFLDSLRALGATESSIALILEKAQLISVKPNEVLLKPGKICSHAYLVLRGGFVCRHINDELGLAKAINFYMDDFHPFMACIDSYFAQTPTQCELRAIVDSTVMALPKASVDELCAKDAPLKSLYDTVVFTALVEENDLKLKIIAYPSERLYAFLLEEFLPVIKKAPSKYIAELMGITPEWLSKLKSGRKNLHGIS